jgi:S1-C subfamily serine protease
LAALLLAAGGLNATAAEFPNVVERIKPSVVAVGTFRQVDNPPFSLRGTGFAVGGGELVATNMHVASPDASSVQPPSRLMVMAQVGGAVRLMDATLAGSDPERDLAILRVQGSPLLPVALAEDDRVREGQAVGFTGFPIGGLLGFSPVTHRGYVSAVTAIALPSPTARQLNERVIRRLKAGSFPILQLDATAYPGNSGSPLYDAESGRVIGVLSMVLVKGTKDSAIGQPSGIAYAVPAAFLRDLLQSLR